MKNKDFLLFRFVPTMKCNYSCSYCFLSKGEKAIKEQMFDHYSPEEWIEGMKKWSDYEVEFYLWGGEPFFLDGILAVLDGWTGLEHVKGGNRIDTNTSLVIPNVANGKLSLNCSWHTERDNLNEYFERIKEFQKFDAVGMVNFVASRKNLDILTKDYKMTVPDLIKKFKDIGVFVNIAADFNLINSLEGREYEAYKDYILHFQTLEDWKQLRCEKQPALCHADNHFFTVNNKGEILKTCSGEKVGNFFEGKIIRQEKPKMCNKLCPSLISYCFREDNNFSFKSHIQDYVKRNSKYREEKTLPKVSIILPTYNHYPLIKKSVDTILNQYFQDFELIIVNDGSTDETGEYLKTLTDNRIKIIHNEENKKLPFSLNRGIKEARGKYITWTSSDNYHARSWINKLYEEIEKNKDADMVYSSFAWINEEGELIRVVENQNLSINTLMVSSPGNASFLYKKSIHDDIGFYDENLEGAEDFDFWLRLLSKYKAVYIPDLIYYYRFHENSMTCKKMDLIKKSTVLARRKVRRSMDELSLVFVANGFSPAGTESYNFSLAKEFQKRGDTVTVIVPEFVDTVSNKLQEMIFDDVKIFKIQVLRQSSFEETFYNDDTKKIFHKLMEMINPDLIHINHFMGLTPSILEGLDIPYVITLNDSWCFCEQAHRLNSGEICKWPTSISQCVQCFIKRNPRLKNMLPELYPLFLKRKEIFDSVLEYADLVIAPTDFVSVKNSVKMPMGRSEFCVNKKKPEDFQGDINYVYMGNIEPTKGLDTVIKAFNKVERKDINLYIYGQVKDQAYFYAVMEQVKNDKTIEYRGPFKNIDKVLEFAHCVIVPSLSENYSTVIREALLARVPVIARDTGGNEELIFMNKKAQWENGILFSEENSDYFSLSKIIDFITQSQLAKISQNIKEPMTLKEDAKILLEKYKEIIGGK